MPTNSESLKILPGYAASGVVWGHPDLISLLERASHVVAKKFPGSVLGVGQMSRKSGGDVGGHASHESGRDADVGFYRKSGKAKMLDARSFSKVAKDGKSADGSLFDDARNWAFVEALLTDPKVRVNHIFVVKHLRTRMLAEAARVGAAERVRERAAEVLMQPRHAQPHDDHFHIRIGCPAGSDACVEVAEAPHVVAKARAKVAHGPARAIKQEGAKAGAAAAQRTVPKAEPVRVTKPAPAPVKPMPKPLQRVQASEFGAPLLDLIGPRVEGLDSAALLQRK